MIYPKHVQIFQMLKTMFDGIFPFKWSRRLMTIIIDGYL